MKQEIIKRSRTCAVHEAFITALFIIQSAQLKVPQFYCLDTLQPFSWLMYVISLMFPFSTHKHSFKELLGLKKSK